MRSKELLQAKNEIMNRYYKVNLSDAEKASIIHDAKDLIVQVNLSSSPLINLKTNIKNQLKAIIFPNN